MAKPKLVVSAVNLVEGGTLSILKDCLTYVNKHLSSDFEIYALVHDKRMFAEFENIIFCEYPEVKSSWVKRIKFEYLDSKKLSLLLRPHLWFCLHDMTSNVSATVRAVYCHNPTPFWRPGWKAFFEQPTLFLFSFLYKYLYKINLSKNNYVVVQQNWIRDSFVKMFNIPFNRIVVGLPVGSEGNLKLDELDKPGDETIFFFPTLPRIFKNVEVIGTAASILEKKGITKFKVVVTIAGDENKYAIRLYEKFSKLASMRFVGILSREDVFRQYAQSDCLIFPSKLETWGLPLTEFKTHNKPIIVADLPYAKETIGRYELVNFFDPDDSEGLAAIMERRIKKGIVNYDQTVETIYKAPVASGWKELFDILLTS